MKPPRASTAYIFFGPVEVGRIDIDTLTISTMDLRLKALFTLAKKRGVGVMTGGGRVRELLVDKFERVPLVKALGAFLLDLEYQHGYTHITK